MDRIYHHYEDLEEFKQGMWRIVRGEARKDYIERAANLMRDIPRFEQAMTIATEQWVKSCEHNLTALDTNRIAWLGHAGNCIAENSPEEATRCGWHTLNQDEQDAANAAAKRVLDAWDAKYAREAGCYPFEVLWR